MRKLRVSFNAPVTLSLVLISFIVTMIGLLSQETVMVWFMTFHDSLKNPLTYIRMFTHIFGHNGWEHFLGNAMYLLLLGPLLEEKYGSLKIAFTIVITAVVTSWINFIFAPESALCGASGVVFAFIVLSSFTGFRDGEIPLSFILVVTLFVGQQIYEGFKLSDNVSQLTHVIGGAVGAFCGYLFSRRGYDYDD